jgi:hypothetical protein
MKHTTLATTRLRFLFLAAKFWTHDGRVGISYRWDEKVDPRSRIALSYQ